uniref:Hydroxymethylglutaryl-CoA synthase n=1 Tax=Parascaris univalens TaxID=6257 RepID=A0A915BNQ1_PARUN
MDAPENVGIRAMELYFPRIFVGQSDLEKFDRVSSGKYTIGLGQREMAFCADNEDIASICMTVLANLLERYEINISTVGFLAVGTETLIDKSKGVKTQLMELFGANTDIEGVDVKNACFGGTQALFHAVDWVYANWQTEKRYAIVVMGDIAIYEPGAARCTGGAGAFAALIGPDALIAFDRGLRASYMVNAWDFYKPISGVSKEFPVVNGPISLASYFKALDATYKAYRDKASRIRNSG